MHSGMLEASRPDEFVFVDSGHQRNHRRRLGIFSVAGSPRSTWRDQPAVAAVRYRESIAGDGGAMRCYNDHHQDASCEICPGHPGAPDLAGHSDVYRVMAQDIRSRPSHRVSGAGPAIGRVRRKRKVDIQQPPGRSSHGSVDRDGSADSDRVGPAMAWHSSWKTRSQGPGIAICSDAVDGGTGMSWLRMVRDILHEIFEESAYDRFCVREQLSRSREYYARFLQERSQDKQ